MDDKQRLLQDMDSARAQMRAVLEGIDTEWEIYPGWTIKHVLAHITGWDDAALEAIRAHQEGRKPRSDAARGIDFYNQKSVETRAGLDYRQVVAEWEHVRGELKALLTELPPEMFAVEILFPWGGQGTIPSLVGIWIAHEKEHADEIETMRSA